MQEIKRVHLMSNEDYLELVRFLEKIEESIMDDKPYTTIAMLEHKKKVLQDKIEEVM